MILGRLLACGDVLPARRAARRDADALLAAAVEERRLGLARLEVGRVEHLVARLDDDVVDEPARPRQAGVGRVREPEHRRLAGHVADPCRAAVRGCSVHEHEAGTALLEAAAELRAHQPELVAEHVNERCVVRRADVDVAAVHPHRQAASGGFETARRSIAG